jgi:Fe2+ or Zn2+ uptake regulation protein
VEPDRFDRIVATLRERGERVTGTRTAVLRVLLDTDHHTHLTAADIAEQVQQLDPGLHRATVYRTLDLLAELGVVEHVHVAHGAAVYHLTEERHQHLVCESCGAVLEAPVEVVDELAARIERDYGFRVRAGHFPLTGLCADCTG